MRYFLDTEFNGFGGSLLSLALVPDDGEEFYVRVKNVDPVHPLVERNVLPYLDTVPFGLRAPPVEAEEAAQHIADYIGHDRDAELIADWPDDISYFCSLLVTGPGRIVATPPLRFRLLSLPGFSTAANSAVPHNALHDARALRDHVQLLERC